MAQASVQDLCASSATSVQGKVTLDVAGRKFITLTSTLEESDFFRALVSEHWKHNRQVDGTYFIDANPDLFQDILEYLRRGWMPLFWDREHGHDLGRYKALQQEAHYFGIPRLERWLKNGSFLKAVKSGVKITSRVLYGDRDVEVWNNDPCAKQDIQMEWADTILYNCTEGQDPHGYHPGTHLVYHTRFDDCISCNCNWQRLFNGSQVQTEKCRVLNVSIVEQTVQMRSEICQP